MKEINLEDILFKHWCEWYKTVSDYEVPDREQFDEGSNSYFVKAMRDAVGQVLELASQRAMIREDVYGCQDEDDYEEKVFPSSGGRIRCEHYVTVDRKSITDTINQVK